MAGTGLGGIGLGGLGGLGGVGAGFGVGVRICESLGALSCEESSNDESRASFVSSIPPGEKSSMT